MQRFQAAIRQASIVIAVSHALAAKTEQLTGLRPRVLPIGIDLTKFEDLPPKEECRNRLRLPLDARIILYAGDLLTAKGIPELLVALRILRDEKILGVFAGGGALLDQINEAKIGVALGPRPNADIPVLMRAADMVVLPSHREGMPTVLIEAGAARTPVLATEVGGIPELLAQDRGFLIPPKQVDALVAAIRNVLFTAGSEVTRRAERLHAYVHENYSVDHNAQTLIGIYRQAIEHHGSIS
jgi:teichuronic acid biosynthesis glycosyltransferase TuaC